MTTANRRTTARRASSVLTAALVATGLTATTGASPAHAADPPLRPVLVCEPGVCILDASGRDSDGDGWSDADETSAGYDPKDPASHPSVLQMIDVWVRGEVRPDGFGLREVVVLPETAPDGSALDGKITGIGPERKDAMTRLGLTNDRLAGLDTSNGLRAVLDLGGARTNAGSVPVYVGGVELSTIGIVYSSSTGHADGSADAVWVLGGKSGSMHLDPPYVDPNGSVSTTIHVQTTTTDPKTGGSTSTETDSAGTSHPNGSAASLTITTTEKKDPNGKVVSTTKTETTTIVASDGTKTETTKTTTTEQNGEGTVTTESSSTTVTDKDGKVVKKTCSPSPCEMTGTEIDPAPQYVPGQVVVATPEQSRALEVRLGGYTRKGETPVLDSDSTPSWPLYSRLNPGTILVDPNNDMVWGVELSAVPDVDKFGGNVTFAPGVNHPDTTCIPSVTTPCPS